MAKFGDAEHCKEKEKVRGRRNSVALIDMDVEATTVSDDGMAVVHLVFAAQCWTGSWQGSEKIGSSFLC